ncbi:MAG: TonB-dependent receptor [Thermodesulfovibrionales bacterium]|nr:TonB-dependent receptor [Thermodesulfovibrionales bacterium]
MRREIYVFLGLISLILFAFASADAEEVAQSDSSGYAVFDLGEVYVTAEQSPAAKDVTVTTEITEEEIKATNSRTVAEALTYMPGVIVSGGRKNQPNIQIRGLDQSRALVLIDGVPYYETNGGKLDLNQIPVDNIAKIEVTKGGASVLYGPNALAGVINIVTKKPREKPVAEALLEVGEYATSKLSLTHGMKAGIFNYWLNYAHQESGGWRLSDDFKPNPGAIIRKPGTTTEEILEDGGFRDNSGFKTDSFWAKVGIEPSRDAEYYLNFHYIAKEKGVPPSTVSENVFTSRPAFSGFVRIPRYDDWGIDLSGQQKISNELVLKAKLFYHNHVDDYASYSDQTYREKIAVSRYKDYMVGGSMIADYRPVQWDIVRFGLQYRGDSHEERDDSYLPFVEDFSNTGSISIENEFNRIKNLSIVAGISYDWFRVTEAERNVTDKNTGDFLEQIALDEPDTMEEFNPMIGATYILSDSTRLFGSVAGKVRFPALSQLYSTKSGNIGLTAEKSINYTLGISHAFGSFASGEFAVFYHDISDFISRDAPGTTGIYRNYAKISLAGFELSGTMNPMKDLFLRIGYTYNDGRDRSDNRVTENVTYVPEHKIDVGINYTVPYIVAPVDLTCTYVSESYNQLPTPQRPQQASIKTGDYFIMNARIAKSFLKHYEAYLAVNNIFDSDYESEWGFPGLGRNFYFGIAVKL